MSISIGFYEILMSFGQSIRRKFHDSYENYKVDKNERNFFVQICDVLRFNTNVNKLSIGNNFSEFLHLSRSKANFDLIKCYSQNTLLWTKNNVHLRAKPSMKIFIERIYLFLTSKKKMISCRRIEISHKSVLYFIADW